MTSYKNILLIAFMLAAVLAGCNDRWEEHIEVSDETLKGTVLEQIESNPNLSTFYGYLQQTGYDSVLTSSKAFTVWAPTNEALQGVDQEIVNDPARLEQFVENHISYQQYFTHSPLRDTSRIETLNGKFIFWGDVKSSILTGSAEGERVSDIYTANGVVHMINTALVPKQSSWEFLQNSDFGSKQAAFLESLQGTIFIDSLAPQIGVDPDTGEPIYDTLAGLVPYNPFFDRGYDISNEDSLNTFIILTDEAFEAEVEEYRQYFNTGDEDSTEYFTSLAVVKDLAFRGLFTPEQLPPFLYSKDGVKVQINEGDIVHVEQTSNGIVYVLDNLDLNPQEKIKPIIIQGESLLGPLFPVRNILPVNLLSHPDKAGAISWRRRKNPQTDELYYDILAYNHDISGFYIKYPLEEIYSTTFDVYMTTYNDFNGNSEYQQKIAFKDPASTELGYAPVPAGDYRRIHLGTYTVEDFGELDMFLVGDESTRDNENPLNLDYVELVPVIE